MLHVADREFDLEPFADHGVVRGDTITGGYQAAAEVLDRLAAVGVDRGTGVQ